ncbi:MAG: hypothetical protein AAF829_06985 [Pseudomonadota bacterium]
MPYWNKVATLTVSAAMVCVPALADGREQRVIQGPTQLQASVPTTCEFGRNFDGSCSHSGTVTSPMITTAAPTVRRVVRQGPQVGEAVPAPPNYDFSGFNGGVGANIATGSVGGGGGVIVLQTGARRFSGINRRFALSGARCCR